MDAGFIMFHPHFSPFFHVLIPSVAGKPLLYVALL